MGEAGNSYKILVEELKRRREFQEPGLHGRLTL
jgi:hypothetical protein